MWYHHIYSTSPNTFYGFLSYRSLLYNDAHIESSMALKIYTAITTSYKYWATLQNFVGAYIEYMVEHYRPIWPLLSAARRRKESLCEYMYKPAARCITHISPSSVGCNSTSTNTIFALQFPYPYLPLPSPTADHSFLSSSSILSNSGSSVFVHLMTPFHFLLSMSCSVGAL